MPVVRERQREREASPSPPYVEPSVPPASVAKAGPACPYCGAIQNTLPPQPRGCRDCGEIIYPWADKGVRKIQLLTANQHEQRRREAWDALWIDLNLQIIEAWDSGDWQIVKTAYYRQARMLFTSGRDHQLVASESKKAELRDMRTNHRNRDVQRVVITQASTCCMECAHLEGREYSIDEALELMPIPVKTCLYQADRSPYGGWCTCHYSPVSHATRSLGRQTERTVVMKVAPHPVSDARQQVPHKAQELLASGPVIFDTETTGLDDSAQIIEISAISHTGEVLPGHLGSSHCTSPR